MNIFEKWVRVQNFFFSDHNLKNWEPESSSFLSFNVIVAAAAAAAAVPTLKPILVANAFFVAKRRRNKT